MPTYAYECEKCKNTFELFQSMTEKPIKVCTKCGGEVKRLIGSGSGIIFKGSGFYATDYKKSESHESKESCPLKKDGGKPCKSCPAK